MIDDRAASKDEGILAPVAPPIIVNRAGRAAHPPLRVVLLNAASGRELEAIAACLKRPPLSDASIILLCEMDWRMRRSGHRELARELADTLGMSFAYVPEFGIRQADASYREIYMGNAILSAEPFEDVKVVPLPRPIINGKVWRMNQPGLKLVGRPAGIVAHARFAGHRLMMGVVHLHSRCSPAERGRQMAAYMKGLPEHGPAVFAGDLNTTTIELTSGPKLLHAASRILLTPHRFRAPERHEPLFQWIEARNFITRGVNVPRRPTFTFSKLIPPFLRPKLDWIAIRSVKPIEGSAQVVPARRSLFGQRISDHDFVMVDIDL
ncbi:MAG TPA: endonuclease/exonuclease/phosphatase family protein [Candidatus Binataceae bacterium]|nr:endonuclease/exonuclease/phosphatase family protein [Candidatus Binataceae bacterium]